MKPIPILLTAALCLTLPACAPIQGSPPPSSTETQVETTDLTASIAAYQAQIDDLQAALLALKEENYVTKTEYEARIRALTAEIAALEAQLSLSQSPEPDTDLPVSGTPQKPPAGSAETDKPPAMAFHYEIRDGRAVILAYLGDEVEVTVPAAIEGYPITSIGEAAFKGTAVVTVQLPYSVTEIGWFAFADCKCLTAVTLPASVESIGYGVFDGCKSLTLICPADSYAARYAESFGIPHAEKNR